MMSICRAGIQDIASGLQQWRLVYLLGSADMRRRFARSKLGQFWIVLSSAVFVAGMGFVWSYLWRQPVADMLPFIAFSLVLWQFISGTISDATSAFPSNANYLMNQHIPSSVVVLALLYRHSTTLLLNLAFPIALAFYFGNGLGLASILFVPGLLAVAFICFWISFVVAIACARFRDLIQVANSGLQLLFFVTPVLWKPELLPADIQYVIDINPFAAMIAVVRDPLLGRPFSVAAWASVLVTSALAVIVAIPLVSRYGRRLLYWL